MVENRELIYEMAKRLDMVIEVWKKGIYFGTNLKCERKKEKERKKHCIHTSLIMRKGKKVVFQRFYSYPN